MNTQILKRHIRKLRFFTSFFLAFVLSFSPIFPSLKPFQLFGWLITKASVTTWDGGGEDNNWSNPANWTDDRLPEAEDIATFTSTSTKSVVIDQSITVAGIDILEGFDSSITQGDDASITVGSEGFRQHGGAFQGSSQSIRIHASLDLLGGSFTSTSGMLSIGGNFSNINDGFYHNQGRVILDGLTHIITGSTIFYQLSKVAAERQTVEVNAGSTLAIQDTLILRGNKDNLLKLRSTHPGDTVTLIPDGSINVQYVDVMDMENKGSTTINCPECVDSGNNTKWAFPNPAVAGESTIGQTLETIGGKIQGLFPTNNPSNIPLTSPFATVTPNPEPSSLLQTITGSNSPDFTAQEPIQFELEFDTTEETILIEGIHEDIPNITRTLQAEDPTAAAIAPTPSVLPSLSPQLTPSPSPSPVQLTSTPSLEPSLAPLPPSPSEGLQSDPLTWYQSIPHTLASSLIKTLTKTALAAEPLSQVSSETITTVVRNAGGEVIDLPVEIKDKEGKTIVRIAEPNTYLKPGKYTLEVSTTIEGKNVSAARDFTWGVVAMNFNKSTYRPEEPAHIGLSVLDDQGHTICDATLMLTITAPDGTITTVQTQDGTISTSPTCAESSVTDIPDYDTVYSPNQLGEHNVSLTTTTANGSRQLNDKFAVTDQADFVVERIGATRIFPPSPYTMRLNITSQHDARTKIKEIVPPSFAIGEISDGGTATKTDGTQTISWDVTLTPGQNEELYYIFDAPDMSPELYLAGPVTIESEAGGIQWQEPRQWQIAADVITNGANAIDALGQYDNSLSAPSPIYTKSTAQNAPNRLGLSAPEHVIIDSTNDRLFLSDFSNNRVLVYNLNANDTLIDRIPDNVLGQTNFYANSAATTQAGMNNPTGMAYDSTNKRLFVVNQTINRVTVYDVTAISDGENAVNVLGQANFTSGTAATSQTGMNFPRGLAFDSTNNRLFVGDGTNNRVTVYDVTAISDGENAVNVLGQANFTSGTAATSQAGMNGPRGLTFDSTNNRLFVPEESNHRVTVYDVAAISDGENAVNVLGQANFTSGSAATSQTRMNAPRGVVYDASTSRLFVTESSNHRVTVYDVAAISDGENAVNVLGQANFTSGTAATTQAGMNTPNGVAFDSANNRLFVADSGNSRVTTYDVTDITDGEDAVDALGQYDDNLTTPGPIYTKGTAHDAPNRLGFNAPNEALMDSSNDRLFLADSTNHRVLVYNLNSDDTLIDRIPDNVLGQANFYTNSAVATQAGMNGVNGLAFDNTNKRLFVVQPTNNRVVVYDVTSISDGENAVNVLGQVNFTNRSAATSQTRMNAPNKVVFDSTNNRLFVSENSSHRTIVYDVTSITDGENAVNVLGQANFTSGTAATSQAGMNGPRGLTFDSTNNRLFVSDTSNNRALVYDVAAITDNENAINVLGQANFITATAATTQAGMNNLRGLGFDSTNSRLFVADRLNNRVVVYEVTSISDGENAVNVLGQTNFTNGGGGATQSSMASPEGVTFHRTNDYLYVADSNNDRLTVYEVGITASATGNLMRHGLYWSSQVKQRFYWAN